MSYSTKILGVLCGFWWHGSDLDSFESERVEFERVEFRMGVAAHLGIMLVNNDLP
jgi:hypothetical protein